MKHLNLNVESTNKDKFLKTKTKSSRKVKNKNSTISKNLSKKFENVKSERKDLKKIFEVMVKIPEKGENEIIGMPENTNLNSSMMISLSNEEIFNEILNKMNLFQQVVNFHEELNNQYVNEVQGFINYFMNYFNEFTKNEDLAFVQFKESFLKAEELMLSKFNFISEINSDENFKNSVNSLYDNCENIFCLMNKKSNKNDNEEEGLTSNSNSNSNQTYLSDLFLIFSKIKNFATMLKEKINAEDFSLDTVNLNKMNVEINPINHANHINPINPNHNQKENSCNVTEENSESNFHSNFSRLARNKLKNSERKRKRLLETVKIRKSKKFMEDEDDFNFADAHGNSKKNGKRFAESDKVANLSSAKNREKN